MLRRRRPVAARACTHCHARRACGAEAAPGVLCVLTGRIRRPTRSAPSPVFHARSLGRPERISRPCARCCCPIRCAASATASPSWWPRPRRRRATPPRLVRGRLRAAAMRSSKSRPRSRTQPRACGHCPNGNVGTTIAFGDKAATDAAFAKRETHRVGCAWHNNRVTANAIEPRTALGDVYDREARASRYTPHRRTRTA